MGEERRSIPRLNNHGHTVLAGTRNAKRQGELCPGYQIGKLAERVEGKPTFTFTATIIAAFSKLNEDPLCLCFCALPRRMLRCNAGTELPAQPIYFCWAINRLFTSLRYKRTLHQLFPAF